jgi:hypothetical protein
MPGFSGQGIVSIAERLPSGLPGIFAEFGNADTFELGLTEESVERTESMSGQRLPYRKMTKSRGGTLKLKGDEFNSKNFARAVIGRIIDVAAGDAVVGHPLPTGMAVGDIYALPAKNVAAASVTLKDSTAGAAKVLTRDTHYAFDPLSSEIKLLNITAGGAYAQPFKADFTPGAYRAIGAFQDVSKEFFVRLKGINTDTGEHGITDVYRVKINPTKALALINSDFLDFELDCTVLADLTRSTDAAGGQFFGFFTAPVA